MKKAPYYVKMIRCFFHGKNYCKMKPMGKFDVIYSIGTYTRRKFHDRRENSRAILEQG